MCMVRVTPENNRIPSAIKNGLNHDRPVCNILVANVCKASASAKPLKCRNYSSHGIIIDKSNGDTQDTDRVETSGMLARQQQVVSTSSARSLASPSEAPQLPPGAAAADAARRRLVLFY